MPAIPTTGTQVDESAIRVLLTGFGPFGHFKENPSWLAVQPLHNTIIYVDQPAVPVIVDDQVAMSEPMQVGEPMMITRQVHISTLNIPVSYEAVLSIIPGIHARPPKFPPSDDHLSLPPPEGGYDLVFHIGVAGRGPLRMERLGHKYGYNMKDADGKLAPLVRLSNVSVGEPTEAEIWERERLSVGMIEQLGENGELPPTRGFGKGYDTFPEELYTDLDVEKIVQHLKDIGIEQIYTSMDAGHYICDFTYYASLAESKRTANRNERAKNTKVLFLHVPPVNQPLSTEDVTDSIKHVITWICSQG